jgi:carboxymethylenebutenolidase
MMMKNNSVLIFSVLLFGAVYAQRDVSLCHTPAADKFALFAANDNFIRMHANPLPYQHRSETGTMVTFPTPNGPDARGYLLRAPKDTRNWIFVFQEWWGLNDHIKREAEKLFNDLGNVHVLALDMYDGKVADRREDAARYMSEFRQDRGIAIIQGALNFAGKSARIATIGWCFGGGQSLQAALLAGKQAVACVMYYGMPEENVDKLKTLNCDVLNIWPTRDQWINKNVMDKFAANMKAAGKSLIIHSYEADHAFANPSNPNYHAEYTADAYQKVLEYFRARLK